MAQSNRGKALAHGSGPEGQQPWRRAIIGGAMSIVFFFVFTLPTWLLVPLGTAQLEGMEDLGYIALMIFVLLVLPGVALGTALIAGMPVDKRTWTQPPREAAKWFMFLAAIPALIPMVLVLISGPVAIWLPIINLVIPAMLAGYLSRRALDKVLSSRTTTSVVLALTAVVAVAPLFLLALTRFNGV